MRISRIIQLVSIPWKILKFVYSALDELRKERKKEAGYKELDALGFAALSVVNLRTKPRYQAEMAAQILMGTPVKVHYKPENSYWMNIETPDGCRGWVNELAISLSDKAGLEQWKKSRRLIVISNYTDFLEKPDSKSQRLLDGVAGCIVCDALEEINSYRKVTVPDGRTAFVKAEDVTDFEEWADEKYRTAGSVAAEQTAVEAEITATAKRFVGAPFLWRGYSAKGFDCSGYVKYVFFLNGYMLPYAVKTLSLAGRKIDLSSGTDALQPADLLFFGHESGKKHSEIITHTAIYLGNSMIAHASHFVRINNVFDESAPDAYVKKILRAKRISGCHDCGCSVQSVRRSPTYFAD